MIPARVTLSLDGFLEGGRPVTVTVQLYGRKHESRG